MLMIVDVEVVYSRKYLKNALRSQTIIRFILRTEPDYSEFSE